MLKVLYLSPAEGEPTGLAAYAAALRSAAAETGRLAYVPGTTLGSTSIPYAGRGLAEATCARVSQWVREGELEGFDAVQIDIGGGSYREYHYARALSHARNVPPYVVTLHDPPFTVGRTLSERWRARFMPARLIRRGWELSLGLVEERRMLESAAAIVTLSSAGAESVRRRFPRLGTTIVAIEHIGFNCDAPVAAARPSPEVNILWLGYPSRESGLHLLIAALGEIAAQQGDLPAWRARIAGPAAEARLGAGSLAREIEKRGLSSHVELPGFVPDEELDSLFAGSHILVIPRERRGRLRHELMSVSGSMIRAMSAGLAVVAADARAATEEIVSGKNGLVVAPGDVHGLAEAIRSLLADPGLRTRLGAEAQEHVRRSHSAERVVADHLSLYLAVARGSGGAGRGGERRDVAAGAVR